MPHLSDGDMSHEGWARQIAANLGQDVDTVVGHSFGGSTLLKMLTETHLGIERLVLLAAPDWSAAGWDVPEYDLPADVEDRLDPALHIDLHHCLDDGVVPAHHQALLAARLPRATVIRHARGGHQFDGEALDAVVRRVLDTRNREPGDHPGVENVGSVPG